MRDLFILLFFYIYFCDVDTFSQCAELAYGGNNGSKDCIELVWNTPPANVNFNITISGQTGTFIYQSDSGTSTSMAKYKRIGSNCQGVTPALPFEDGIMNYQGQTCIYSAGTLPVSFDKL